MDTGIMLQRVRGFVEGFWWILPNLGIAIIVFVLFLVIGAAMRRMISAFFQSRGRLDLAALLAGSAQWGMVAFGLLVVATIVFPSVKPGDILATIGVGSIAIGFAFKDILQNWLAGLLILLRQPFTQGDQIAIGSHEGTVEKIESRATLLRTYDGRRVVIPNSDVYTQVVIVNTAFDKRRSEYDVGIGASDDIDLACCTIVDALRTIDRVSHDPAPEAIPWELAESSVNIRVRWWSSSRIKDIVQTRGDAVRAIKRSLAEAGIDLPFPTNVVLFHDQTEETDGNRRRQREGWPAGDNPPAPRHLNQIAFDTHDSEGDAVKQGLKRQGSRRPGES